MKYEVYAKMTVICKLEVEANSFDEAHEIAKGTDGGEFADTGDGDWYIDSIIDETGKEVFV